MADVAEPVLTRDLRLDVAPAPATTKRATSPIDTGGPEQTLCARNATLPVAVTASSAARLARHVGDADEVA